MLQLFAEEICTFLQGIPGVKSTVIIGSLAKCNFDKYSDIDIEVDVSGMDNGQFLMELPKLFAINLKHYLRDWECYDDIVSMYKRIGGEDATERDEAYMLEATYAWLMEHADDTQEKHLLKFAEYIGE